MLAVAPWRPGVHIAAPIATRSCSPRRAVGRRDRGLCRGGDVRAHRLRRAARRCSRWRACRELLDELDARRRRRRAPAAPRRHHARERRRRVQQPPLRIRTRERDDRQRRSCRSGGRCCGSIGGRSPLVATRCSLTGPPALRAPATSSPRPTGAGASRWRGTASIGSPILIPIDEGVGAARHASALEEEGRRVQRGYRTARHDARDSALHRALMQNPAAAETLNPGMSASSGGAESRTRAGSGPRPRRTRANPWRSRHDSAPLCGSPSPSSPSDERPCRQPAPVPMPRLPRRLAPPSTSTARARSRASWGRCGSPRDRASRFSAPTSSAKASPARRSAPWRAHACCSERFDVQIGVREATASIDAPCPVRRLSTSVVRELLAGSDAIVLQGPVSDWYPEILASDVPIAVDLYDPMNLEALESRNADQLVPYTTQLLRAQVARGDFFFCASERQRDYWIGMLAGAGRVTSAAYRADPDLRQLVDVVPFGIPDEPPRRTRAGRARRRRRHRRRRSALHLERRALGLVRAGALHPRDRHRTRDRCRTSAPTSWACAIHAPRSSRARRAAPSHSPTSSGCATRTSSSTTGRRTTTRQNVYLDATAAVSFHRAHLETRFSFRTRILDCIWASLPIVCSSGDVLADLVRNERARHHGAAGGRRGRCRRDRAHRRATTRCAGLRETISRRSRTGTPGAPRSSRSSTWLARPSRSAPAMDLDAFELDERTDPPPGSLTARVPLPLRQHVLGPAKRGLKRASTRLGDG